MLLAHLARLAVSRARFSDGSRRGISRTENRPIDPRTVPAMAMPRPRRPPGLVWLMPTMPKISASRLQNGTQIRMPQTRLATAMPLVPGRASGEA